MLKSLGRHRLQQRGDTIVEVMIVLAVLGLAISISYATANQALLQAREAQENTKATQLLQSQIEKLRTMTANLATLPNGTPNNDTYIYKSTAFCINNASQTVPTNDSACVQQDSLYNVSINYDAATDTFMLKATWENIQGQGQDETTLSYRVHKT